MKKFLSTMFALLCLIVPSSIIFSGCGQTTYDTKEIVNSFAEKLQTTNNLIMESINTSNHEVAEVSSHEVEGEAPYFKYADLGDYLNEQSTCSMIIYSLNYLINNTTAENGYADGFKKDQVYCGEVNVWGYNGVLYAILFDTENGIAGKVDLNASVSGVDISYKVNVNFEYDNKTKNPKKLQINYVTYPMTFDIASYEIDFENNSFKFLTLDEWQYSHTPTQDEEIFQKYNDGTLNFETVLSYPWNSGFVCTGNITNDINKMNFSGYKVRTYDYSDEKDASVNIVKVAYNSIYHQLSSFSLRSQNDSIDEEDGIFVTYLNDATTYGYNKSDITPYTYAGKTYYKNQFIEYNDFLSVLNILKTNITADSTSSNRIKETINNAIAYTQAKGESLYTGSLGLYNSLQMNLKSELRFYHDFVTGTVKPTQDIFINSYNDNVTIRARLSENNTIESYAYYELTPKFVYGQLTTYKNGNEYSSLSQSPKEIFDNIYTKLASYSDIETFFNSNNYYNNIAIEYNGHNIFVYDKNNKVEEGTTWGVMITPIESMNQSFNVYVAGINLN